MQTIMKLAVIVICLVLGVEVFAQGIGPTPPGALGPGLAPGGPGAVTPFNAGPAPFLPTSTPTSPSVTTTTPADAGRPAIDITEAAGTLTDPMNFIYLSKEFVFQLLVLANALGVPGVQFNADALPQLYEVEVGGTPSPSTTQATRQRSSRSGSGRSYETETVWVSGSTEGGRRTVRGAQYLAGQEENVRTVPAPAEEDSGQMLSAITVTNNEDLAKLVELVKDLPGWQRVGRFPLQTTQKQKLEKAIANIYAQAFQTLGPGGTPIQFGQRGPYASDEEGEGGPPAPPPGQPPEGPPPIDPQAMGEWYYYYQQAVAWERYANEEVLMLKQGEPTNMYDLDTAIQPQELYFAPSQGPNAPPNMIHLDKKETPVALRLGAVKPASIQPALDQITRVMKDLAVQNAKKDSDRSREFVAHLDTRKERRFRYREWLNDQTTEIRKMAEDYRRRLAGEEFVIDGVQYLISQKPLTTVPLGSRNIVTERLTPYDLLDSDGTLKKATEESVEQTP